MKVGVTVKEKVSVEVGLFMGVAVAVRMVTAAPITGILEKSTGWPFVPAPAVTLNW